MKFKLLVCFILVWSCCFAQENMDSLREELNKTSVDSVRLRLHFVMAQQFLKNGTPDSQFVHASAALKLAINIKLPDNGEKKFYAGSLRLIGIYYRLKGDYEKAIDYYLKTLTEFEILKDTNGIASTINSIGLAYLGLNRYDEAFKNFNQAYQYDKLLNKPSKVVADLTNMSYALLGDGNRPDSVYREALRLSILGLDLAKKIKDKQLLISSNEAVAVSLFNLKRYDESMVYQQQALKLAEELHSNPLIAEQLYLIAQLYNYKEDYNKAIEFGLRSEQIAVSESITPFYYDIYNNLAISYGKTGNWKKAYEYSQKVNVELDSTYKTQIAEQLKRFESERKDNQIFQLSTENEIKEKQNQLLLTNNQAAKATLQNNRILLFAAVGFIILLSALLYVLYRNRQTKIGYISQLELLNEKLEVQKDEIIRINTILELKALRAQMNPHFIFNCMSSIQECILTNRIDDANLYLAKLSRLMRMVLEYSDDEMISLDKEILMLELYLNLESIRLKGNFEYTININNDIYADELNVPTLILQPFAENAIWHGLLNKLDERRLTITIELINNMLHCNIEDNGIGRTKAAELKPLHKANPSRGINLVKKRLEIINQQMGEQVATLNIFDALNQQNNVAGTRVEIILPAIYI